MWHCPARAQVVAHPHMAAAWWLHHQLVLDRAQLGQIGSVLLLLLPLQQQQRSRRVKWPLLALRCPPHTWWMLQPPHTGWGSCGQCLLRRPPGWAGERAAVVMPQL